MSISSNEFVLLARARFTRHALRIASIFVLGAALASLVIFALAAWAYPGGNHFDHAAKAHDFWRNSLCDVARGTAIGGASNRVGSLLARVAMSTMALGLGGLFWLLPHHFDPRPRVRLGIATWVRALGLVSVPGAIAVTFMPTDRFGVLHGVAIILAGVPGLGAAVLAMIALLRSPRLRRSAMAVVGLATLLAAALDFGLYVHELATHGGPRLAVPVLERVAALLLALWMVLIARQTLASVRLGPARSSLAGRDRSPRSSL